MNDLLLRGGALAALGLALLSTISCEKSPAGAPAAPPMEVTVATPIEREVLEWDEFIGRLEAMETVEVRARVSGLIDKADFTDGQIIKKGDLLFEIDPRPFQAELDRLDALTKQAETQVERAKGDVQRAESAGSALAAEESERRRLSLKEAEANVGAAKAARDAAALNVEFTQVRAPIGGRLSRKLVTAGNLINGGAGQATLLTTITSLDPIYCYVDADEASIQKYQKLAREGRRQTARKQRIPAFCCLSSEDDFDHEGYIDFVDNRLDPNTGTLKARGVFRNNDDSLIPGFFARLRVPGSGQYHAMLVPDSIVGTDQGRRFVYVVNSENKVEYRAVELGAMTDGLRAIVGGLKSGERVIINGIQRIRPGAVVKPLEGTIVPQVSKNAMPSTMPTTLPVFENDLNEAATQAASQPASQPAGTTGAGR